MRWYESGVRRADIAGDIRASWSNSPPSWFQDPTRVSPDQLWHYLYRWIAGSVPMV